MYSEEKIKALQMIANENNPYEIKIPYEWKDDEDVVTAAVTRGKAVNIISASQRIQSDPSILLRIMKASPQCGIHLLEYIDESVIDANISAYIASKAAINGCLSWYLDYIPTKFRRGLEVQSILKRIKVV